MELARRVHHHVGPDPVGDEGSQQDRVPSVFARRESGIENVLSVEFSYPRASRHARGSARQVGVGTGPPGKPASPHLLELNALTGAGRSALGWVPVLRAVAGPQVLEETEAALTREWAIHERVPETIRIQLGIAVAEIVANTIEHGSAGRHRVQMEMRISLETDRVRIILIDDGNESHVDVNMVAMPDCLSERGRGLAMARLALDGLVYYREGVANCWLLTSKPF